MDTIILGGRVMNFVGAVGADLIFTAVRTTSDRIIASVRFINSSDKSGTCCLKVAIERLDIDSKVSIINSFTNELNGEDLSESLKLALVAVENILHKIENEIKTITNLIEEHNQLYFSYWRSLDYSGCLSNLKTHCETLDTRVDLLLKLLHVDKSRFIQKSNIYKSKPVMINRSI